MINKRRDGIKLEKRQTGVTSNWGIRGRGRESEELEKAAERHGEKRGGREKEGELKREHGREEMNTRRAQCEH